jgi:cobalamin synthase
VGSFAVVGCATALLALCSAFLTGRGDIRLLLLIPVVSRCGSALAVTLLRPMSTSQYARQAIEKKHAAALLAMLAAALAAGFLLCGVRGFVLVIEAAAYGLALLRGYRALDGMNGDVAGYALTIAEVFGAIAFALI